MDAAPTTLLPGVAGKRCAHCNTHTTPLWRNGPDGPKTLCNACGVRDNRRHAKANKVAKPAAPKVPKSGKGANGKGEGKKRSAASPKKEKASKKAKPARDYFAPKVNIHVPNFNVVQDYDAAHPAGYKQTSKYLRGEAPDHQLNRFGPGTAAPMYEATKSDFQWLEHMNSEPLDGNKSVCTTTPNAQYMRPEHLEKLFDVFEESSWAASSMLTQEQAAHAVLGNVFSEANTPEGKMDDVLHWASNAHLGDGQLVSLKGENDGWAPFDISDEHSNQSSSDVAAAPLTPSESVDFLLKRGPPSDQTSVPSDNDDSSTQSADDVDGRYVMGHQQSENVKSSDLGTRAYVGLMRRGGKSFIARGAQVPRPPTGGKSELKNAVKTINQINNRIFKISKHAPSLQVLCKVYKYWLKLRWKNGGRPLLSRFDPMPPLRLRERPETATEAEQLKYLFCFDLKAVSRQQRERALRVEQAEAQKKRRRRPCFNPAATKRRRRVQAAMDDAVTRPLTITFDPLDELFAHGWNVVEYNPECEAQAKKLPSRKTPVKTESSRQKKKFINSPAQKVAKVEVSDDAFDDDAFDEPPHQLKSPMGVAAAKAGALMKNIVSSVGTALGYTGSKNCVKVNGRSVGVSGPSTPVRRSTRAKSNA